MIEIVDLTLHLDARGWLFEGWRGAPYWYATSCFPGVVKAWHRHQVHTDRMCCVSGLALISVYRDSANPNRIFSKQIVCGPMQPKIIVIPPGYWHGFTAIGGEACIVVNSPDELYDPADEERAPWDKFPVKWVFNG